MQTTFDNPFGTGTGMARALPLDETLVVLRTEDGGMELLGEEVTLLLSPDDLRTLLFYGSAVELEGAAGATAVLTVDPRRYAITLVIGNRAFRAPRWAIQAVARGRLPAAYLQVDDRRHRPALSASSRTAPALHAADAPG
jgi:hypothetical protein